MPRTRAQRTLLLTLWLAYSLVLGVLYASLPPSPDLQIFDYIGWIASHGGTPYVHATEQNWPGAIWLHTLAQALFGPKLWAFRAFDYLLMLLTGALALRVLVRDAGHALASTLVVPLYQTMYVTMGYWMAGQRDVIAAHALLLVCIAYLQRMRGGSRGWLVAVGALMLFVVSTRPTYALFAPLLFTVDLGTRARTRRSARTMLTDTALALACFGACLGLLLAYAAYTGALEGFRVAAVAFNLQIYGDPRSYADVTRRLLNVLPGWYWYLAFAALGAMSWWRSGERLTLGCLAAIVLTGIGSAFAQRKGFAYHLGALVPVMAALIAQLLGVAVQAARTQRTPLRVGFASVTVLVTVVGLARKLHAELAPQLAYVLGTISQAEMLARSDVGNDTGHELHEAVAAAEYVRARTSPRDTVLVWGRHVLVNTLAQRRSPTPFITAGMLELANPPFEYADAWNDALTRALEGARAPAVILVPGRSHPGYAQLFERGDAPKALRTLRAALAQRYRRDASFGTIDAYLRVDDAAPASARLSPRDEPLAHTRSEAADAHAAPTPGSEP